MSGERAALLVKEGHGEWLYETWVDGRGKEHDRRLDAVRLTGHKTWKGVVSARGSFAPMKVMQLVN